jgi:hypothetical protein
VLDDDRVALPETEPHSAPIFDTGPYPSPLEPLVADPKPSELITDPYDTPTGPVVAEINGSVAESPATAPPSQPIPVSVSAVRSVVVPGQYYHVKRWTLVMLLAGVWIAAAVIGLGLYYWWYHSLDKTPPVFAVMVYLLVCTVGGLIIAMLEGKPLLSGTSIALMSAPFPSTAAAAALYGSYVFGWVTP